MKIRRSTKCSLKYLSGKKRDLLETIRVEYTKAVNFYIDAFWGREVHKTDLLAPPLHSFTSWFSHRLKKIAAREALDFILSATEKAKKFEETPIKPMYSGDKMQWLEHVVFIQPSKNSTFNLWVHIASVGNKIIFDIPIKLHIL
jgi:hypothetical protein